MGIYSHIWSIQEFINPIPPLKKFLITEQITYLTDSNGNYLTDSNGNYLTTTQATYLTDNNGNYLTT